MTMLMTRWQAALLALVACGPMASLAQDAAEADASSAASSQAKAPKAEETQAPARPFIERSLVIAPEQVGKFTLDGMSDFPGSPGSGISVRYQHADFPTVRIDVFVYPAGRVKRYKVLASELDNIRSALEQAAEQGKYTDLTVGDPAPFDLGSVAEDGSVPASAEPAADDAKAAKAEADPAQAILDALDDVDYRKGRRLTARLTARDEPQNSLAFVFYRGLYLVKGRISASPTLLPGEAFDRFANHAMASLVPVIAVRSTGGCAKQEITIPDKAFASEATLAGMLTSAASALEQEACTDILDEAIPEGHRAMPLEYTPDMWN